jgi:tetratricopeptide (TPR) repeat protein
VVIIDKKSALVINLSAFVGIYPINGKPMSKHDSSKLALVIGVDVYHSEGLEDLSSCRKDAEDVCKILQGLDYTIFQNGPIIGSRLNKENSWVEIHRAIVSFFDGAKPGHTLLFYFSGHGIQRRDEIYLAMPGVNTRNPMIEGFSLTRLTELMNSSKSMQIVSIIDACYSGAAALSLISNKPKAMVAKESAGRALATYDRLLENIPKAEGRCLLLSSQAYEPSLASDDSYSLYTKHLIDGLKGTKGSIDEKGLKFPGSFDDDGNVTPETLHRYLYHKVANEAEQVPKIKSDMASNIVLAHYPDKAKNKPDVNSIVREGDEHLLRDEYDKAIEYYDRAIESDPYLVDAWHKKGNALYNKENYVEAIKCYDRASLINPKHFESWYKKGITYKKRNDHAQAIKSFDKAIEIRADNSDVWYEKALSLSHLKRHEEAIKCYDNAIEINPKHAAAWYWKGRAFYDLAFNDKEKVNEALMCYNRAKEINPDFPGEWYGDTVSVTESKAPLPTNTPSSSAREESNKEPVKTAQEEEQRVQQPSSPKKSWKWMAIAGGIVGVILISIIGIALLPDPPPSVTPTPTPTPTPNPTGEGKWTTFDLTAGGQTYPIEYRIIGGSVEDMTIHSENQTLQVTINSPSNGTLALRLPREVIDSKTVEGSDADFAAFIDNDEYADVGEIEPAADTRTLLIGFPAHSEQIDVIGGNTMVKTTSKGTLDIGLEPLWSGGGQARFNVAFLNPGTNNLHKHQDYDFRILKDNGQELFSAANQTGQPILHNVEGTVTIPYTFQENGDYTIQLYLAGTGIDPPIPTDEEANFPITVAP